MSSPTTEQQPLASSFKAELLSQLTPAHPWDRIFVRFLVEPPKIVLINRSHVAILLTKSRTSLQNTESLADS